MLARSCFTVKSWAKLFLICLISLMFCFYRRFTGGVLFLVLACLTKPQAVLIIPVVAMAVFAEGSWRALWRYAKAPDAGKQ